MEDKQIGLYKKVLVNVGHHDERYDYEVATTGEVLPLAWPQAAGMIRGLVRAAELLEGRELDIGHREIWDTDACRALQDARDHGWCVSPKPVPAPKPEPPQPQPQSNRTRIVIEAVVEMTLDGLSETLSAVRRVPGVANAQMAYVEGSPEFIPFAQELTRLLNAHSKEGGSNTPDYVLASYLQSCLDTWNKHVALRDKWYGVALRPGGDFTKTAVGPA